MSFFNYKKLQYGFGEVILYPIIRPIGKLVDPRQEAIIRWGRRLKDVLQLPKCLRIFRETDPGMALDDLVLLGFEAFGFCACIGVFVLASVYAGTPWTPVVVCPVIGIFGLLFLYFWMVNVLVKRRRERKWERMRMSGDTLMFEKSDHQTWDLETGLLTIYVVEDQGETLSAEDDETMT